MKRLLNLSRALQALATRAHVKALCLVADKCDRTVDGAAAARSLAGARLDAAADRYALTCDRIRDSVSQARATRHAAIVEAQQLGYDI